MIMPANHLCSTAPAQRSRTAEGTHNFRAFVPRLFQKKKEEELKNLQKKHGVSGEEETKPAKKA